MTKVFIRASGLYTPESVLSNDELVTAFNQYAETLREQAQASLSESTIKPPRPTDSQFIERVSGIKQRFVLRKDGIINPEILAPVFEDRDESQLSHQAEMAVNAAQMALHNAKRSVQDVDGVIVACSNMERPYPAISIEVQNALGIQGFAFDLNVACASAVFGVQTATDFIKNGHGKSILVISPEICTAHLNFKDRDSHFIFGDAATALLIESDELTCNDPAHEFEIMGSQLQTQFSNNIRNNFGFLKRSQPNRLQQDDCLFRQHGTKVFKDVVKMVSQLVAGHLDQLHIEASQLKRLWLHQANHAMNLLIAKKILGDLPEEEILARMPQVLSTYGNTSSAGSIISFHLHHDHLNQNDLTILCAFGAGYSVGNAVLRKT